MTADEWTIVVIFGVEFVIAILLIALATWVRVELSRLRRQLSADHNHRRQVFRPVHRRPDPGAFEVRGEPAGHVQRTPDTFFYEKTIYKTRPVDKDQKPGPDK